MNVTQTVYYIGVNDHRIDLFEGQYAVPNGMAYNSYVIVDQKIAVLDTVDSAFGDEWLQNLKTVLGNASPDYLIVQHMEPDHSANIFRFLETYPTAAVVATAKAFVMMKQFFGTVPQTCITVGEGDTLNLGDRTLSFLTAPMVHWPEVMLTYDSLEHTLFSADAFGKFGALDVMDDWACEARRYYFGIVGKYGAQVQTLLKKAAALSLSRICPLHGPVLTENLDHYITLYNTWSSYAPESRGVTVAYVSMYGNTKKAALSLARQLEQAGKTVSLHDLARDDMAEAVEDAFRYDTLVLASPTYNMSVFPPMRTFITHLTERNFQNRKVAFIENGSWAPASAKVMRGLLEPCKNITFVDPTVTVISSVTEQTETALATLAAALA